MKDMNKFNQDVIQKIEDKFNYKNELEVYNEMQNLLMNMNINTLDKRIDDYNFRLQQLLSRAASFSIDEKELIHAYISGIRPAVVSRSISKIYKLTKCKMSLQEVKLDPIWDPLRDHPEYLSLLKKHTI